MLNFQKTRELQLLAAKLRRDIVIMIGKKGHVGHIGGSCSCADIVAVLYGYKMKYDPNNPKWENRDKFLMSKGHAAIIQYAALTELGVLPRELLPSLKSFGSILQGHPDIKTPGIEANTGSLGQGLSISNGMALAMRLDGKDNRVYCIMGDGEVFEGQIWEAAMSSVNFKIDNLVAILDRNRLTSSGILAERFDNGDMVHKWKGFGWHVIEIDGHDIQAIADALDEAETVKGKPTVIIANTIKGKGIRCAENVVTFHNGALTEEQYNEAMNDLNQNIAALEQ